MSRCAGVDPPPGKFPRRGYARGGSNVVADLLFSVAGGSRGRIPEACCRSHATTANGSRLDREQCRPTWPVPATSFTLRRRRRRNLDESAVAAPDR